MKNYIEFCNEQAEKLFQIIDQNDGLLKWQKTWQINGCSGLPRSGNGFYQGVNLWKLLGEQVTGGYGSATWLTFNQVKKMGGHVLKGSVGTRVCFFQIKESGFEEGESDNTKTMPLFRLYTVFNFDQTSLRGQGGGTVFQPQKMQELLSILGVNISEFGNQPCFQAREDVIVMPRRECFNSGDDFDVTLLHELVHWTGHESRLNRGTIRDYGISDTIRAEEELIAEIGSVFLASYFGVAGDLLNHASYVSSWKKYLDGRAVGRAISQASKAFNWLISHVEGRSVEVAA